MDRKKLNSDLYKKIYLIRRAEQGIIGNYNDDGMKTPMHMSMGEEAITAGLCYALGKEDQVFGYYRSHALYISKTNEVEKFFGEMYGKVTGTLKGIGGSMHLSSPSEGLMAVSAVVASTIAPAVGAAFANKYKKNGKIVVSFFGDGAIEEGVMFESLNIACLMKLPIIFVCEDNGLAVDVTAAERQGFKSIPEVVKAFDCHLITSSSTDVEDIYYLALNAIELIKKTQKPVFMHLKYYRYLQHLGIISDFDLNVPPPKGGFEKVGYRSLEEYRQWLPKDPVKVARAKLISLGITELQIKKIEKIINTKVVNAIKKAQKAPFPKSSNLMENIYAK